MSVTKLPKGTLLSEVMVLATNASSLLGQLWYALVVGSLLKVFLDQVLHWPNRGHLHTVHPMGNERSWDPPGFLLMGLPEWADCTFDKCAQAFVIFWLSSLALSIRLRKSSIRARNELS